MLSAPLQLVLITFNMVAVYSNYNYNAAAEPATQGVAKIRHYESLHTDPSMRLYHDPYAQYMYMGSFGQTWLGERRTLRIYDFIFKGLLEMITLRTKWIDDEIMTAIEPQNTTGPSGSTTNTTNTAAIQQMIILGAGYDTRGFRLDLPDGFLVIEVDQPGVQKLKRKTMESIATTDETVASRMKITTTKSEENDTKRSSSGTSMVEFLEIDFNKDSIGEKLLTINNDESSSSSSCAADTDSSSLLVFDRNKKTIVIFEGVTQYVPKTSTASTLKQLHAILPSGSILLISYVPQDVFDDPIKCGPPGKINMLLKGAEFVGEPWISSWTTTTDTTTSTPGAPGDDSDLGFDFKSFLYESGPYEYISDTTVEELNDKYLVPRNRGLEKDTMVSIERYVVAAVVKK